MFQKEKTAVKKMLSLLLCLVMLLSLAPGAFAAGQDLSAIISRGWDGWSLNCDSVIIPAYTMPDGQSKSMYIPHSWGMMNAIERLEYLAKEDASIKLSQSGRSLLMLEVDKKRVPESPFCLAGKKNEESFPIMSSIRLFSPALPDELMAEAAKPVMGVLLEGQAALLLPEDYGTRSFTVNISFGVDPEGSRCYGMNVVDEDGNNVEDVIIALRLEHENIPLCPAEACGALFGRLSRLEEVLGVKISAFPGEDAAESAPDGRLAYLANDIDGGKSGFLLANVSGGIMLTATGHSSPESGQPLRLYMDGPDPSLADSDYSQFRSQLAELAGEGAWLLELYEQDTASMGLSRAEDIHNLTALALSSRFDLLSTKLSELGVRAQVYDPGIAVDTGRFIPKDGRELRYELTRNVSAVLGYDQHFRSSLRKQAAEGTSVSPEEAVLCASSVLLRDMVCSFLK